MNNRKIHTDALKLGPNDFEKIAKGLMLYKGKIKRMFDSVAMIRDECAKVDKLATSFTEKTAFGRSSYEWEQPSRYNQYVGRHMDQQANNQTLIPVGDMGHEYELTEDNDSAAWIAIGNKSLYLHREKQNLSISVYRYNDENGDELLSFSIPCDGDDSDNDGDNDVDDVNDVDGDNIVNIDIGINSHNDNVDDDNVDDVVDESYDDVPREQQDSCNFKRDYYVSGRDYYISGDDDVY